MLQVQLLVAKIKGYLGTTTGVPQEIDDISAFRSNSIPSVSVPVMYQCDTTNSQQNLETSMSNYLYEYRRDHRKDSTYGSVIFNYNSTSDDFKYLLHLNGSAYHAVLTYANMANQQLLRLKSSNPSASIKLSLDPMEQTSQEKGKDKQITG